jgi:hypothetical protein
MYKYLSFVYYKIATCQNSIVFHGDNPQYRVRKILAESEKGKQLFLASAEPYDEQDLLALNFLYFFIVSGMCNINSKDTYNSKLKSFFGSKMGANVRTMSKVTSIQINPQQFSDKKTPGKGDPSTQVTLKRTLDSESKITIMMAWRKRRRNAKKRL